MIRPCLRADICVYFVASEALPKTGQWTLISKLYVVSLVWATASLAVSIVSVSLFLVRPSQGLTSEKALLDAFVQELQVSIVPPLHQFSLPVDTPGMLTQLLIMAGYFVLLRLLTFLAMRHIQHMTR